MQKLDEKYGRAYVSGESAQMDKCTYRLGSGGLSEEIDQTLEFAAFPL